MQKLLLLSNSSAPGQGYLTHARDAIAAHLEGVRELLFVPYALADHDAYTEKVRSALQPLGIAVRGAHTAPPGELVAQAEAVFVGGGNSFRLLSAVYAHALVDAIRQRVAAGAPYMGSSAGTNMACPSLRTTNDMPIVQPPHFAALDLVPFQINPHYLDPDPKSRHQGETREERLTQFLEENDVPVLGMREGTWLRRDGSSLTLHGTPGGRLFARGAAPRELSDGAALDQLLQTAPHFDSPAR